MNPKLEAIRRRIENEHSLINQRLSWLVSSQAFLLSAFAISLNAPKEFAGGGYLEANHLLVRVIPLGGIACISLIWLALWGAIWSLSILRREANAICGPEDLPIINHAPIRLLGLAAPVFIPAIFLALWIVLLIYPH
ncbi:hypothetical protein KBB96_00415 [Luteolibacter ambystomatis]|uniref:Uncharacterized protein n=1 Tax=Luteolibacter ambystomatis TaxID=2824561 RepID=A0A975IZK0_9BACT|nr:hypothetical protein [Luteolibacter ambystomatis]QUE51377.1 hypothetical protein KBB96_00415 [Luteolibacter ambystomatis]